MPTAPHDDEILILFDLVDVANKYFGRAFTDEAQALAAIEAHVKANRPDLAFLGDQVTREQGVSFLLCFTSQQFREHLRRAAVANAELQFRHDWSSSPTIPLVRYDIAAKS